MNKTISLPQEINYYKKINYFYLSVKILLQGLYFANKQDAINLKRVSKKLKELVLYTLNEYKLPNTLPNQTSLIHLNRVLKELALASPSKQVLVTKKEQWDAEFIIHFLKKSPDLAFIKQHVLYYAAKLEDTTLLNLLKCHNLITAQDVKANNNTALGVAAENGNVEALLYFKDEFGLTTQDAKDKQNYALRMAAQNGHVGVLSFLKNKFGLTTEDARDKQNYALRMAAQKNEIEVLGFLKDEFGLTTQDARDKQNYALRMAAQNGHVGVLSFLKNKFGLTTEDARDKQNYALRMAAEHGHENILLFLFHEFELTTEDARDKQNYALRMAAQNGHTNILIYLKYFFHLTNKDARSSDLESGYCLKLSDLEKGDFFYRTNKNYALRMAAQNGKVEVLRFLKDEFNLTKKDASTDRNDAFKMAAQNGDVKVLRFLEDEWDIRFPNTCCTIS
ncbi:MAG: ankyrin repeat domain-containing protein [Candidatus Margulisiibacteriota bacterium]|nr:ankyrin repeat domain-containing protein [Candidatus Margulisiibacteriota bacterium]